jgi:hypothetical protein
MDWGWDCDFLQCPDFIADNIHRYQTEFDKWLYDKSNDHGLWLAFESPEYFETQGIPSPYEGYDYDPNGRDGVCWGADDFINWINKFVLHDEAEKVVLHHSLHGPNFKRRDENSCDAIEDMVTKGVPRIYC